MRAAIEALVGPVERLTPVMRGFTHNERVVATLRDGRSVFAKRAVDEMTAQWLRREHQLYETLGSRHFVPRLLGWIESELPILVLEDLTDADWPPPWDRSQIDGILSILAEVSSIEPPPGLPVLLDGDQFHFEGDQPDEGWDRVMARPAEFLSLGLCDGEWLDRVGPTLLAAAAAAPLAGRSLLHCDVRSDNLCFRHGSAVLFDWNLARVGNPLVDIAFWLPSLAGESGVPPEDVLPGCPPELAAFVAGFFASRAGQPVIPHAPRVRQAQLEQLRAALPWAVRTLGLTAP